MKRYRETVRLNQGCWSLVNLVWNNAANKAFPVLHHRSFLFCIATPPCSASRLRARPLSASAPCFFVFVTLTRERGTVVVVCPCGCVVCNGEDRECVYYSWMNRKAKPKVVSGKAICAMKKESLQRV
jgi:hypothetical protein